MHNFFYEFPLHFDREYFWKNRRHHHKNEKIHKITTEAVSKKCRKTLCFHHSYLNCFDLHVCFYFLLFGFFDTKSVSIALSSYPIRLNINGILTISDVMLIIFIPKFFVLFIEWKCGPINDLPHSMHVCLNVCVCVCARQNIDMRQTSKHLFWCFFLSPIATICSPLQLLRYCCYCYCHCCYCYYYHYFLFVKKKVSSPRVWL